MLEKKVAIVVDNNSVMTKDIIAEMNKKYKDIKIFDFSELNPGKFNFFRLMKLIYKLENLDLTGFDLVISISNGFANGIITNLDTKHQNITVGVPNWYFLSDSSYFKNHFRIWMNLAMDRPNSNSTLFKSVQAKLKKINPDVKFEIVGENKHRSLEKFEKKDNFYALLAGGFESKFLDEMARMFNHTGKKVYIIGTKKLLSKNNFFSSFVEFIDIENSLEVKSKIEKSKAIIFDQYFDDYDFLNENIKYGVGVLSFRNGFIKEYFEENVFELDEIDSFENEFAKFVSWAKINDEKKIKCLKVGF